jgi:hypothetical protein
LGIWDSKFLIENRGKKSEFALVGIRIYINWELGNFDNRGIGIKFGGFVGLG